MTRRGCAWKPGAQSSSDKSLLPLPRFSCNGICYPLVSLLAISVYQPGASRHSWLYLPRFNLATPWSVRCDSESCAYHDCPKYSCCDREYAKTRSVTNLGGDCVATFVRHQVMWRDGVTRRADFSSEKDAPCRWGQSCPFFPCAWGVDKRIIMYCKIHSTQCLLSWAKDPDIGKPHEEGVRPARILSILWQVILLHYNYI